MTGEGGVVLVSRRRCHPVLSAALKQKALVVEEEAGEVVELNLLFEQVEGPHSCCWFICLLLRGLLSYFFYSKV